MTCHDHVNTEAKNKLRRAVRTPTNDISFTINFARQKMRINTCTDGARADTCSRTALSNAPAHSAPTGPTHSPFRVLSLRMSPAEPAADPSVSAPL